MRSVAVLVLVTSGCSLTMKRVDSSYDGKSEPACEDSLGPVIADGLLAGLLLGVGVAAGNKSVAANDTGMPDGTADALALTGLVGGLVFAVSAVLGESTHRECKQAKATWRLAGAIGVGVDERTGRSAEPEISMNPGDDPNKADSFWCGNNQRCTTEEATCAGTCTPTETAWCVASEQGYNCGRSRDACTTHVNARRARRGAECVERKAALWKGTPLSAAQKSKAVEAAPTAAAPRGFFCAISPSAARSGFCMRERSDCESTRDVAIAGTSDLAPCALVEFAHCFDADGRERCFPTADTCTERSGSTKCDERK